MPGYGGRHAPGDGAQRTVPRRRGSVVVLLQRARVTRQGSGRETAEFFPLPGVGGYSVQDERARAEASSRSPCTPTFAVRHLTAARTVFLLFFSFVFSSSSLHFLAFAKISVAFGATCRNVAAAAGRPTRHLGLFPRSGYTTPRYVSMVACSARADGSPALPGVLGHRWPLCVSTPSMPPYESGASRLPGEPASNEEYLFRQLNEWYGCLGGRPKGRQMPPAPILEHTSHSTRIRNGHTEVDLHCIALGHRLRAIT